MYTLTTYPTPTILRVVKRPGIAGQFGWQATVQYPGEPPMLVMFIGNVYGGPVVQVTDGNRQTFVTEPSRFGPFTSERWVHRFFGEDV